ncbi:SH3 domain-containing protein [Sphingomonas bacterium]|uniref:SH3 domain-containing protein n=1 Tax=Sphingomonas bacterium TaxID=1895847 RepID=UPI0015764D24|nr:SH3 domain-containing protein [Sphingomonas bacterium]
MARWRAVTTGAIALLATMPLSAQERPVPYWASIAKGEALMRTGPDRTYPALWLYRRRDLPVRVVQVHGVWRRIEEQDGTTGWMLAILLSARRTGVVVGGTQAIRDKPEEGARLLWQAEPGAVGRLDGCDGRWCRIEFAEKKGWIAQSGLWGTGPGERLE